MKTEIMHLVHDYVVRIKGKSDFSTTNGPTNQHNFCLSSHHSLCQLCLKFKLCCTHLHFTKQTDYRKIIKEINRSELMKTLVKNKMMLQEVSNVMTPCVRYTLKVARHCQIIRFKCAFYFFVVRNTLLHLGFFYCNLKINKYILKIASNKIKPRKLQRSSLYPSSNWFFPKVMDTFHLF